jgi:predicted RNA-binding protein YlqC (UPF0109 family)
VQAINRDLCAGKRGLSRDRDIWLVNEREYQFIISVRQLLISYGEIEMKEFLETLVKNIVDSPEEVEVTEVAGESVTVLNLKVAKKEIGLVIGKKGRNIEAIRILLSAASGKAGKKTVLEIIN